MIAIGILTLICLGIGVVLGLFAVLMETKGNPLVENINQILPQTQCGQCSYPGCRPYAQAIAEGQADINQCPPGGEAVIEKLADLLGVEPKPLNEEEHGSHADEATVVIIREELCIGCTLCIKACPVDAIVGAAKKMHTVIESECTGCNLCIPPCPVDCIDIVPVSQRVFPLDLMQKTELDKAKSCT